MACKIFININGKPKFIGNSEQYLNLSHSDIAEIIMLLPKEQRKDLADLIKSAKSKPLTEDDILSHRFISNTSIDQLFSKFPELKDKYKNVELFIEDNPIIIFAHNVQLNNKKYSGRVIDSNGNEIFILNNEYNVDHFLGYLQAKTKILKSEIKSDELNNLSEHYQMSVQLLLFDFLNNRYKYIPYKEGDKLISPANIIYKELDKLLIDEFINKTDFELSMENNKESIDISNMYDIIETHYGNTISKSEFLELPNNELIEYVYGYLINDPVWSKVRITRISPSKLIVTEAKTNSFKLDELKQIWKIIQTKNPDLKLDGYDKMKKNNAKALLSMIKNEIEENGYNNIPTDKLVIEDNKLKYTIPKTVTTTDPQIHFEFPYNVQLGNVYDYSYNTESIFDFVEKYKGAYIYKYNKDNIVHYVVTRHIISPNHITINYSSLEKAKLKIDRMNESQKISKFGLWSLRSYNEREVMLEDADLNQGQIITVSNVKLPIININRTNKLFKDLFYGTVNLLQEHFLEITSEITKIDNPEKAAAFLLLTYKQDSSLENKEIIETVIKNINSKGTISYEVESFDPITKKGMIRFLDNDGNKVQMTGKYNNNISITSGKFTDAVEYFNKQFYGSEEGIIAMSLSELIDFSKTNNLGLESKMASTRAFVYNGKIYINTSNANLSDLFHEISHIFMGILKVKYPNVYIDLVKYYKKHKNYFNQYESTYHKYRNFAEPDIEEEVIANLIAEDIFKNKSLLNGFNSTEIDTLFNNIFNNLKNFMGKLIDTSLSFNSFISSNLKDSEIAIKMNKNMKISLFLEEAIRTKKIKKDCNGV